MCMTCSRRSALFAAAAVTLGSSTGAGAQVACVQQVGPTLPPYCGWNSAALENFQVFSTSGRSQIDRALIAELRKILAVFPINPGFKYINDTQPNAFAHDGSVVANTQGTVYIGLNLINSEFERSNLGGIAVAGICAHECGHIYQYFNGWMQKLQGQTALHVELHADFLAGYYFGKDRSHAKDNIENFAQSLFSKGDYNFNDRNHHGTPQQRVAAMRRGYEVGQSGTSIAQAADSGANIVRSL